MQSTVSEEKKEAARNHNFLTSFVFVILADKYIVQADIRLDHYQYEENLLQKLRRGIDENFPVTRTRRAARTGYLWKNNTIYYKIDSGFRKYLLCFLATLIVPRLMPDYLICYYLYTRSLLFDTI